MTTIQEDINYIDECLDDMKGWRSAGKTPDYYLALARLFEAKALLTSLQKDDELSLEDLE